MPTGAENVRFQGRTGSNQTTVEMTRLTQRGLSMNLPLLHSLRQGFVSKYAWIICFVSIGPESFAGRRGEIANERGAGVKPHTKSAALAIVMIASSSVVEAQEDGRPSTASPPGTTQGPWTSVDVTVSNYLSASSKCLVRRAGIYSRSDPMIAPIGRPWKSRVDMSSSMRWTDWEILKLKRRQFHVGAIHRRKLPSR